ncbi:MAG TPA: hypothetical protein VFD92_11360 [Candidatus Binatia bacterium]|nr:hypothetical protein [Candidatus Binatia bacterium]
MHAAPPLRRRSARPLLAMLVALALLASCARRPPAAPAPGVAGERGVAGGPDTASAPEPVALQLAPDPELQRLIDPRPAAHTSWLGGDVAASLAVSERRWVWIFGDTLLGTVSGRCAPPRHACRRRLAAPRGDADAAMIANSVGVMALDRRGRPDPVVEFWRSRSGVPAPVFESADPEDVLWPLAMARIGHRLLVAISRHTRASGLVPLANLLVLVENPLDRPDRWRTTAHTVPNVRAGLGERDPLTWTTALVADGGWVYVFGQRGVGLDARTVLARFVAADVARDGWQPEPEYLVGRDAATWTRSFALDDLQEVAGLPGTSEAVFEHSERFGWVTFQIPPLAYEIRMYTAPALAGPWSDRGVVYRIPPPWSTEVRTDCRSPEIGCGWERFVAYAAKSHPGLAPPGGFAVTYNVNLFSGTLESARETAESRDDFYVPQFVAGTPFPR